MIKSSSSEFSDLSRYCSLETLRQNATQRQIIEKKKHKTIVDKFMATKDLPIWYRTLSGLQLKAADSLFDDIRDDVAQGTQYRVRHALIRLGLHPIESSQNIKVVLQLSRGNDLAFLWFLLELFYKDTCNNCEHKKFECTANQQIIMTAIAHLDMITTIRELDKILPHQPVLQKEKVRKPKKIPVEKHLSPYLWPLPKPKFIEQSKKYNAVRSKKISFNVRYDMYKDPNFILKNESNRWYALPEKMQEDFDFGLIDRVETTKIVDKILDRQVDSIFSNKFEKEKILDALCLTHNERKQTEEHMKHILMAAMKSQNREHFNLKNKKKFRRKKAAKQIEKEVRQYEEILKEETEKEQLVPWIKCFINNLIDKSLNNTTSKEHCLIFEPCTIKNDSGSICRPNKYCACFCLDDEFKEFYDFGHSGMPKPCEIYFHAPQKHKPYKFEYKKIFNSDDHETINNPIKYAIFNALELENYANSDDAIDNWMKTKWNEEVKEYNKNYDEMNALKSSEIKMEHYDPRDNELMDSMLKDAFEKLKENPKFVFATLPNAYKHPVVKQFIKRRYGHILSEKERLKALKQSKKIFDFMQKKKLKLRPPYATVIGTEKEISFKCRNYLYEKSKTSMAKYVHNISTAFLEASRIYWQAMEPFHTRLEHTRDTFYAFLPARELDIKPFRPWKNNEYMDAKNQWEKRVKKREAEEKAKL